LPTGTFKICIFGNGGVGKTSLIQRYVAGHFSESTKMTIGVDIASKRLEIEDWKVTLQIWDFGGEDRFRFFLPTYASGSSGGVFMYDLTRYSTLMEFDDWIKIFNSGANTENNKVPILMVGGKADLEEKRSVTFKEGCEFSKSHNMYDAIECSAKNGQNVELIFKSIARKIMENLELI